MPKPFELIADTDIVRQNDEMYQKTGGLYDIQTDSRRVLTNAQGVVKVLWCTDMKKFTLYNGAKLEVKEPEWVRTMRCEATVRDGVIISSIQYVRFSKGDKYVEFRSDGRALVNGWNHKSTGNMLHDDYKLKDIRIVGSSFVANGLYLIEIGKDTIETLNACNSRFTFEVVK